MSCYNDNDCGDGKYCSYNSSLQENECIDKNYDTMSVGCIPNNDLTTIQSMANVTNVASNKETIEDCVNWARTQTCDGNQKCNYMVYKEAPEMSINWDSFSATIGCGSQTFPITDFLKPACIGMVESCNFDSSNSQLQDILKQGLQAYIPVLKNLNGGTCSKYTLTYSYKCNNDPSGQTSTKTVDFTEAEVGDVAMNITCPFEGDDSSSGAVCMALNLTDELKSKYSSSTDPTSCSYPIYNTPNYYSADEITYMLENQYSNEIKNIEKEMAKTKNADLKLRGELLMYQQKKEGNTKITLEKAIEMVEQQDADEAQSHAQYSEELYNMFSEKIQQNLELQKNDNSKLRNMENEKIVHNKNDIDGLDQEINNITNKIYKSQKTEKLNVKITYFLSLFLGIILAIAVLVFIFIIVKNSGKGGGKINMNNMMNNNNINY